MEIRRKSVVCSILLIAPLLLYYGYYNVVEMRVHLGDKSVSNKKGENDKITSTSSSHSSANGAGNVETKTVLPTPPNLDQLDCPRFAFMRFTKNGLGQKLSELVFGLNLAKQTNSNYVLHTELLTQNGKHGNYSWILDMLPLHNHYVTRKPYFEWKQTIDGGSSQIRTIGGQWNSIVDQSNQVDCNVAFSANFFACCDDDETQPKMDCPKDVARKFPVKVDESTTSKKDCQWVAKNSSDRCLLKTRSGKQLRDLCKETCDNCPKSRRTDATCYCTQSVSQIGTFEEQKDLLRGIWKESTYQPPHKLSYYLPPGNNNNRMVSIVWHVRVGDLVLHNDKDYFGTIASQIVDSFRGVDTLLPYVFVMGEGGKDAILQHFDFWPELCYQYFDDRCVYPDLNAQETFYHMVQSADILVTTGSSFPAGAAMLRSHGITLATMPKEGLRGVYGVSENIDIEKDGTIPELGKVTAFLETLLNPQ